MRLTALNRQPIKQSTTTALHACQKRLCNQTEIIDDSINPDLKTGESLDADILAHLANTVG